jgi:hypothetical protein
MKIGWSSDFDTFDAIIEEEMETFNLFSEVTAEDASFLKRGFLTFKWDSGYLMEWP